MQADATKNFSKYSQAENIGPQVVMRTSPPTSPGHPLTILFDHPRDVPNWRPGDVSEWLPGDVLIWNSREVLHLTSKRPPWEVVLGCPQDFLRTSPRRHWKHVFGTMWVICWMSLNLFLLFFWWLNLCKNNSVLKMCLEHNRTSKMELFFQN